MTVTNSTAKTSLVAAARRVSCYGALAACLTTGCSSGPSRVQPPSISPSGAASSALEMFDKDGDGFIAGAELDESPGIKAAMTTIDTDQDGKVTADEIQARIEAWQASRVGVMASSCQFYMDGKPLAGAQVTFEPEPFLGEDIKAAVGETGTFGGATVSVPKEQRATPQSPSGFQVGLYRVQVSKKVGGKEVIPAKYNTATIIGQQISPDDPKVMSQKIRFDLTSK